MSRNVFSGLLRKSSGSSNGKLRKATRSKSGPRKLQMDSLEKREMMSVNSMWMNGDTLVMKTDSASTTVTVSQSASTLLVRDVTANRTWGFSTSLVRNLEFQGGNGDDRFYNLTSSTPLRAFGGAGNDYLYGGNVRDELVGGAGNDTLIGNGGDDYVWGGDGRDEIHGGSGADRLQGEAGDDRIYAGSGNDYVWGGSGRDRIEGGSGNDVVRGGGDDDRIYGNAGHDTIFAESGNDTVLGGDGNDYIQGGSGNDHLQGDNHDDSIYGDTGHDYIWGGNGADNAWGGYGDDVIRGGSGNDLLRGDSDDDYIDGDSGDDILWGQTGEDTLLGGDGNDQLVGGTNDDHLNGEAGNDKLWGESGNDTLISIDNAFADYVDSGTGVDVMWIDFDSVFSIDRTVGTTSLDTIQYVKSFANGADRTLNADNIADPTDTGDKRNYTNSVSAGNTSGNHPLFSSQGPQMTDIKQGSQGDCWLLAGLGAIAGDDPNEIRARVVDFNDGTYGVKLGNNFYRVDNELAVTRWSAGATDDNLRNAKLGAEGSLWAAIVEKAYTHYRRGQNTYASLNGGWGGEVNTAFGATSASFKWFNTYGSMSNLANDIYAKWATNQAVSLNIQTTSSGNPLVASHVYTVSSVQLNSSGQVISITLRNPWGHDGGDSFSATTKDGYVTVTPFRLFYLTTGTVNWGRV